MKTIKYITLFTTVFLVSVFGQMRHDEPPPGREKIEQLEKIKLIEVLRMGEETTLRFFARRSEMKTKLDSLHEKAVEIIADMEKIVKDGNSTQKDKLKKMIEDLDKIQFESQKLKSDFIKSLDDILTTEQIAKVIIFEKNFKDELRRILMYRKHSKMYQN